MRRKAPEAEREALAACAAQVLVSQGWSDAEAASAVKDLGMRELRAILCEAPPAGSPKHPS
jgi:hypothetical protein